MNSEQTTLYMTVGVPGCGKSTWARKVAPKGLKIYSAEAIRGELYGDIYSTEDPNRVYRLLQQRVIADLEKGISCIYVASNMNRIKRREFLNSIPKNCRKICVYFLIPPSECRERQAMSKGKNMERDINEYLRAINLPYWYEGWDEIIPIVSENLFTLPMEDMLDFSQDNPHHRLTLGQHMNSAYEISLNITDNTDIQTAAKYHDCGKYFTKDFRNKRGIMTDRAHFYGHANYGAYLFMLDAYLGNGKWKYGSYEKAYYIAQLINWHMHPLEVWDNSGKAHTRDRKLMGKEMMSDIMVLHRADIGAH